MCNHPNQSMVKYIHRVLILSKALPLDFKDETDKIEILTGKNKVHSPIQKLLSSESICGKLAEK